MTRRLVAALLAPLLLVGLVLAISRDRGTALGPVIAITPDEVISNGFVGHVFHPDLSDRGETAGILDEEVIERAFVHLDDGDAEPMQDGTAIAVSGDGCSAVHAIRRLRPGVIVAAIYDDVFILTNRCNGVVREFLTVGDAVFVGGSNRVALSHDGRYLAVELRPGNAPMTVARVDTSANNSFATMPLVLGEADAEYGLDISDDGNIVVVTVTNGKQTEVAAWNVPNGTSALVSGDPNAGGWSAYPSVSGDGRWVAFASSRGGRLPGNGPWVYVADRSTNAIHVASDTAVAAYETSVSDDGAQVAYSANPNGCDYNRGTLDDLEFDCIPTQINVSFGSTPGFAGTYSSEIISLDANGRTTPYHVNPVLSGNGRWVAWVSDQGRLLMGSGDPRYDGRHAFLRRRDASLSVSNVSFGSVIAPGSSSRTSTVTNTGRSTVDIASVSPSPGSFVVTGGSCGPGVSLPPGGQCTVDLRFDANGPSTNVNGSLTVAETGYDAVSGTGTLRGAVTNTTTTQGPTTTGPTTTTTIPTVVVTTTTLSGGLVPIPTLPPVTLGTLPGTDAISATPDPVDFGDASVLIASDIRTVTVSNSGTADAFIVAQVTGDHADDFELVGGSCRVGPSRVGSACTLDYRMTASASGVRTAELTVSADDSSASVTLTGIGRFEPRLVVTPRAVTERGITTIVGQGFPPGDEVVVQINDGELVLTATPGDDGAFRIPISPLGQLELGNHTLAVDDVPSLYEGPEAAFVVVLPTFTPQGPSGPAFNNSVLVARG